MTRNKGNPTHSSSFLIPPPVLIDDDDDDDDDDGDDDDDDNDDDDDDDEDDDEDDDNDDVDKKVSCLNFFELDGKFTEYWTLCYCMTMTLFDNQMSQKSKDRL